MNFGGIFYLLETILGVGKSLIPMTSYCKYAGRLCSVLFLFVGVAHANPTVSQTVVVDGSLTDEMGEPLMGNDPGVAEFGFTHVEGDLVQILFASDNTIYPPAIDGTPNPLNQILKSSRIGNGTVPFNDRPGNFGANLSPRPGSGSRIFVRVFNAPTIEESSFYQDSDLFVVDALKNTPFIATMTPKTDKPLDPSDPDGDGMNNSWEKSRGTDPNRADTDGDGVSDYAEFRLKTDMLDADDFLQFLGLTHLGAGDFKAEWPTKQGVKYRIEGYPMGATPAPNNTKIVGRVTGNGQKMNLNFKTNKDKEPRIYRVSLDE